MLKEAEDVAQARMQEEGCALRSAADGTIQQQASTVQNLSGASESWRPASLESLPGTIEDAGVPGLPEGVNKADWARRLDRMGEAKDNADKEAMRLAADQEAKMEDEVRTLGKATIEDEVRALGMQNGAAADTIQQVQALSGGLQSVPGNIQDIEAAGANGLKDAATAWCSQPGNLPVPEKLQNLKLPVPPSAEDIAAEVMKNADAMKSDEVNMMKSHLEKILKQAKIASKAFEKLSKRFSKFYTILHILTGAMATAIPAVHSILIHIKAPHSVAHFVIACMVAAQSGLMTVNAFKNFGAMAGEASQLSKTFSSIEIDLKTALMQPTHEVSELKYVMEQSQRGIGRAFDLASFKPPDWMMDRASRSIFDD